MAKRKQFTVSVTVVPVPLPPEKVEAYKAACRLLFQLLRETKPTT